MGEVISLFRGNVDVKRGDRDVCMEGEDKTGACVAER